jgi:protein-S-isoprenylcysteine O-methyltransferase Ste14
VAELKTSWFIIGLPFEAWKQTMRPATAEMWWNLIPLAGTVLFIGIAFGWRPWLHLRRYGTWGVLLFRSVNAGQTLRDSLTVMLWLLLLGQAIVVSAWIEPRFLLLAIVDGPTVEFLRVIGSVLLFLGLIVFVRALLDLGASWRIGIEEDTKPGLVTSGLYRFCRNPIFLALLIFLTGYTLLLLTPLSLALLLGTYIGVRQQTSAEEDYLRRAYGNYHEYARLVGRFLPGIGRLR